MQNNLINKKQLYLQPDSVKEALAFASEHKDHFKYVAGGTDVFSNLKNNLNASSCIIDLSCIKELSKIKTDKEYLKIGSMVRLSDLGKNKIIKEQFSVLIEAADSVGSPLIRNTATLGGNILCENRCFYYNQSEWWREAVGYCLKCNGDICIVTNTDKACYSEMVSDTCPALISMGCTLEIEDLNGIEIIPLENIYTGDGVSPRNLSSPAIVGNILLPLNRNFKSVFHKLRQRQSLEFTSLTSVVTIDSSGKLKICLAGVDPKPVYVTGTIKSQREELIKNILSQARSVDNDMFSRKYRREMIKEFLKNSFNELSIK